MLTRTVSVDLEREAAEFYSAEEREKAKHNLDDLQGESHTVKA